MAQGWTVAVHSTVTVYGIQHTAYGRRHKAVGIRPYFLVFELLMVLVPYRNSSGVYSKNMVWHVDTMSPYLSLRRCSLKIKTTKELIKSI